MWQFNIQEKLEKAQLFMALQKLFIGTCNFMHTISVLRITFYMLVLQKMHGIVQILKMIQLGFTYSITSLNSWHNY